MSNVKLTYLNIFNVPYNFWFSRVVQNIWKTQCKCQLRLEKCKNCSKSAHLNQIKKSITIPMWFTLPVLTFLASSVARKEYLGWRQLKPVALFESILLVLGDPPHCFCLLVWSLLWFPKPSALCCALSFLGTSPLPSFECCSFWGIHSETPLPPWGV